MTLTGSSRAAEEAYRAVNGLGGFQLVERAQTRCPVSALEGGNPSGLEAPDLTS